MSSAGLKLPELPDLVRDARRRVHQAFPKFIRPPDPARLLPEAVLRSTSSGVHGDSRRSLQSGFFQFSSQTQALLGGLLWPRPTFYDIAPEDTTFEEAMSVSELTQNLSIEERSQLAQSRTSMLELSRPELLRAVPTSRFLHRRSVLASSKGTEADYRRSERCEMIGTFISHNWSCDPTRKWLALVYFFYHRFVWLGFAASFLVLELLTLHYDWEVSVWRQPTSRGVVHVGSFGPASVFTLAVFVAALFLAAPSLVPTWLVRRIGRGMCFLDKCSVSARSVHFPRSDRLTHDSPCLQISQTDAQLKQSSIKQLGGYIARSKRFLMVMEPGYVTRVSRSIA